VSIGGGRIIVTLVGILQLYLTSFVHLAIAAFRQFSADMCDTIINKSKGIPVTGRGGLQVCKMLRIPHYLENRLTDEGGVVPEISCSVFHTNFC
jgi:hypothetical protein